MLTERQLEIVLSVVYEYIQTGEPAGSRTISKKYLRGSSPATIRNEMADLEEMGYFYQPHTSAGRLPTSKAYRSTWTPSCSAAVRPRRDGKMEEGNPGAQAGSGLHSRLCVPASGKSH